MPCSLWELILTFSLALLLYSSSALLSVVLLRRRVGPEKALDAFLTPIARLGSYAALMVLVPWLLAVLLNNETILWNFVVLFTLLMLPSLLVGLVVSSSVMLLDIIALGRRAGAWPAVLSAYALLMLALYLVISSVITASLYLPEGYMPLFAVLAALFSIGGLIHVVPRAAG